MVQGCAAVGALVPRARTAIPAYGWDSPPERALGLGRGSSRGRWSDAAAGAANGAPSIERRRGEKQPRIAAINCEMLDRVTGPRM